MGSKRSSSKKATNDRSSPPPVDPSADGNHQNPKNPSLVSPSKSRKKPKVSAPISTDSSIISPAPSTDGEAHFQNGNRKGKAVEVSNEISPSDGSVSRYSSARWGEADNLKFLKALIAFREKNGILPTHSSMMGFLTEIKDWAPGQLSEKYLDSKLRHLRFKFQKLPKPRPASSEFDRSFHELASKLWGPESLKAKGSATGDAKENGRVQRKGNKTGKKEKVSKKPKGEKKKVDGEKEDEDGVEEEERNSVNDEGTDEKAEKSMVLENGEEHEKDELLVDGDNVLLDAKGDGHSYKYLRMALEEYWTESKMDMYALYAALLKVDPVQAKHLDEQFRELFVGMLKLKMESNKVSNRIIGAALGY